MCVVFAAGTVVTKDLLQVERLRWVRQKWIHQLLGYPCSLFHRLQTSRCLLRPNRQRRLSVLLTMLWLLLRPVTVLLMLLLGRTKTPAENILILQLVTEYRYYERPNRGPHAMNSGETFCGGCLWDVWNARQQLYLYFGAAYCGVFLFQTLKILSYLL